MLSLRTACPTATRGSRPQTTLLQPIPELPAPRNGARAAALLVLLAVCALVGCSDGSSKTNSGSTTMATRVAAEDFSAAFASAYCQIGPCCQKESYAFSQTACEASITAFIDAGLNAKLADPGVSFDETAASACVESYRKLVTACTDESLEQAADSACQAVYHGTVPEGGACLVDEACSPIRGAEYANCDHGLCKRGADSIDAFHAGLGQPCRETCAEDSYGYGCSTAGGLSDPPEVAASCYKSDGLYCTRAYVCAPLPKIGEACPESVCDVDSYCNGSVCVASGTTGPCPTYEACLSTSYCDDETLMCIPLKDDGSSCNGNSECASDHCNGGICQEWSIASQSGCAGSIGD